MIPKHVALIPDGNRRWAKEKGLEVFRGHEKAGSFENVKSLIKKADELGIEVLSTWGFSTENWKRNDLEKGAIFRVIENLIDALMKDEELEKVRFIHIGRKDRLPRSVLKKLEKLEEKTSENQGLRCLICLDYGGRDEVLRAVRKLVESGKEINEENFSNSLDTSGIPDVDFFIRTSGEKRTSGFMPFQSVYAEFCFVDKKFPDFTPEDLESAVKDFGKRDRRIGN